MAYASATDLTARFDSRIIADLASDSGTPASNLATDAAVAAALDDASGRIESAMSVGQQYSAADLAALTGTSLALLKRLCCQLAMIFLMTRRQDKLLDDSVKAAKEEVEDYLDRLRKGERIFGAATAQLAASVPNTDGPTALKYDELNLLPDRTRNFYPSRGSRLPIGRG